MSNALSTVIGAAVVGLAGVFTVSTISKAVDWEKFRAPRDVETITAEAAREMSNENPKGLEIKGFVSALSVKIKLLAGEGKSSLDPWVYLGTRRGASPTYEQREDVKQHFKKAGFEWKDHAEHPHTTLSW